MPSPTNPAWSGSCPLPPPEISATFPCVNARRRTNFRSSPSITISPWTAAKPSRLSDNRSCGALISFFILTSPSFGASFDCPHEAREPAHDITHQIVKLSVLCRRSEVRQVEGEDAVAYLLVHDPSGPRMGACIGLEEGPLLHRWEVTDLEDGIEVLSRDGNGICRV